jgi:hypothetical protein
MRDMWKEYYHILFSKVFLTKKILLPNLQIAMKHISLQSIWVKHSPSTTGQDHTNISNVANKCEIISLSDKY